MPRTTSCSCGSGSSRKSNQNGRGEKAGHVRGACAYDCRCPADLICAPVTLSARYMPGALAQTMIKQFAANPDEAQEVGLLALRSFLGGMKKALAAVGVEFDAAVQVW